MKSQAFPALFTTSPAPVQRYSPSLHTPSPEDRRCAKRPNYPNSVWGGVILKLGAAEISVEELPEAIAGNIKNRSSMSRFSQVTSHRQAQGAFLTPLDRARVEGRPRIIHQAYLGGADKVAPAQTASPSLSQSDARERRLFGPLQGSADILYRVSKS